MQITNDTQSRDPILHKQYGKSQPKLGFSSNYVEENSQSVFFYMASILRVPINFTKCMLKFANFYVFYEIMTPTPHHIWKL